MHAVDYMCMYHMLAFIKIFLITTRLDRSHTIRLYPTLMGPFSLSYKKDPTHHFYANAQRIHTVQQSVQVLIILDLPPAWSRLHTYNHAVPR